MKFEELPEGHYYVHAVGNAVAVQRLEDPETAPRYVLELETMNVVHDGRQYRKHGQELNGIEVEFKTFDDMAREQKARGASLGHIKCRIMANEPLKGKMLERALELVTPLPQHKGDEKYDFCIGIANKLKAGEPLNDYERHMVVDVWLPHARLA